MIIKARAPRAETIHPLSEDELMFYLVSITHRLVEPVKGLKVWSDYGIGSDNVRVFLNALEPGDGISVLKTNIRWTMDDIVVAVPSLPHNFKAADLASHFSHNFTTLKFIVAELKDAFDGDENWQGRFYSKICKDR